MPLKYNPVTNRFENTSPPTGTTVPKSPTTTGAPKPTAGVTGGVPSGVPSATSSSTVPKTSKTPKATTTTTSTTVPKKTTTTTTAPKQTTTTTTAPKKITKPLPPVNPASRDNGWQNTPVGQEYVDTKTGERKIRQAGNKPDTVVAGATGNSAGGFRQFDQNTIAPVGEAYTEEEKNLIKQYLSSFITDPNQLSAFLAGLDGGATGGSGGGSSAAIIKAQAAADADKAQRAANKRGAADLIKAGQTAQNTYNAMGQQQATDIMNRANEYYGGQKTTALANIDAATADFFKNLIAPQAYANAPVAQLTPEQQGLMQNLQSYGATGGQAAQQMSQDVANNQFTADLMRSSNRGLQSAESDYFNSLRNAATGGQMASRQGLETLITGLQGQAQSDADKLKRDYLLKGLEALISGQTNAANMLAGQ